MKSLRISGLAGGLALVLSALAGVAQAQQAAPSDAGAMPAASADAAGVGPDRARFVTRGDQNNGCFDFSSSAHPRESGDPVFLGDRSRRSGKAGHPMHPAPRKDWVPAFAGMSGL